MIKPKTDEALSLMRKSGEITAKALKKVIESSKEGVSLIELDKIAEEEILRLGGKPSFKTVEGYEYTTCLSINNEVVHGLPRDIKLKKGDIFSIDLGTVYKGWHTDSGWSIKIGESSNDFLRVGEKSLWNGIDQALAGNRIGDIAYGIQSIIEAAGFSVVQALVGHGVGKALHEEPEVPGFGKAGTGILLIKNMTLAIEVMYTAGRSEVEVAEDGWTIVTADDSLAGFFEMTVIVGDKGPEVLTDWRKV